LEDGERLDQEVSQCKRNNWTRGEWVKKKVLGGGN